MDTKYLVHCTARASISFKHGNWRGEPRWESNAVDALLDQGRTVHSTTDIWLSPDPRPPNLYDLNMDWVEQSVQISYGVASEIYTGAYPAGLNPKYRLVQYYDGPTQETRDTFFKYAKNAPGSIVATTAFQAGLQSSRLKQVLGAENVEWVAGPTVPCVHWDHCSFEQTGLLWAHRNFVGLAEHQTNEMKKLFSLVASWLNTDPALEVVMLVTWPSIEIGNRFKQDGLDYFFSFACTTPLTPFKDRVKVHTSKHWIEVLEIMSKTKLVISPAEQFGGPPFEAGSYGIPSILQRQVNPFVSENGQPLFPEVLGVQQGASQEFLNTLERLHTDRDFYCKHGNGYRKYIDKYATYAAFVARLEEIATRRGWVL